MRYETPENPCQWPPKTDTKCRRDMWKNLQQQESDYAERGIRGFDGHWLICDEQGKFEWHQGNAAGHFCVDPDRGFQVYAKWDPHCHNYQILPRPRTYRESRY